MSLLDYLDQHLDDADPREAVGRIATHLRTFRPEVALTFGPDGAYGHPDHIAISQFTTAAIVAAADATFMPESDGVAARPHAVSKLYYLAWPQSTWTAYQASVRTLSAIVDGIERHATPWPDWAISTVIETSEMWPTVWRAASCHQSQLAADCAGPGCTSERVVGVIAHAAGVGVAALNKSSSGGDASPYRVMK